MNSEIDWLMNIKENVYSFIQDLNVRKDFSYFKYSYSGDIYDSNTKWGLGQLVFATKILHMIDKIKSLNYTFRSNLSIAINSFQDNDGYYTDKMLFKLNRKQKIISKFFKGYQKPSYHEKRKRAETRQSFAALLALSSKPINPFVHVPYSKGRIDRYLATLDWTHPWDAGSHFSHLLFFIHYNGILFRLHQDKVDDLTDYAINWVNKLQSPSDGCWHQGLASVSQKINGAMKILNGLATVNKMNFSYPERIIDTALKVVESTDACNDFNVVYVLYCCSKMVKHRANEIQDFCLRRLNQYREYYFEDNGGFSFHKGRANEIYYSARITKGLNEPDIHGTAMFLWGITLISQILKRDWGLKEPIT